MGCSGCGKKDVQSKMNVDKHGVPIESRAAMENTGAPDIYTMSYVEYTKRRDEFRAKARDIGNKKIESLSDDYKRIQIDELVSVYNHDEVHFKLTPTQALIALWEFAHHPAYTKIFDEFEGLREQIDTKHAELMANKISLKWSPK